MRVILIGCEYTGKTTLADALEKWGAEQGRAFHMDDHFSIPDEFHIGEDEQKAMVTLLPAIKERFQRFQNYYHLDVMANNEDIILAGFHIEEAIYGPRYYYPDLPVKYTRRLETNMPEDTILVLLAAEPDVIRNRMEAVPHRYQLVQPAEVEEVQAQFEAEFRASWLKRRTRLDTTDLKPEGILDRFFEVVRPKLNERDLLLIS